MDRVATQTSVHGREKRDALGTRNQRRVDSPSKLHLLRWLRRLHDVAATISGRFSPASYRFATPIHNMALGSVGSALDDRYRAEIVRHEFFVAVEKSRRRHILKTPQDRALVDFHELGNFVQGLLLGA